MYKGAESKASGNGVLNSISEFIDKNPALVGSLLGGLVLGGTGGAIMTGDRKGETSKEKRNRRLKNALLGAAIGSLGAGGIAYGLGSIADELENSPGSDASGRIGDKVDAFFDSGLTRSGLAAFAGRKFFKGIGEGFSRDTAKMRDARAALATRYGLNGTAGVSQLGKLGAKDLVTTTDAEARASLRRELQRAGVGGKELGIALGGPLARAKYNVGGVARRMGYGKLLSGGTTGLVGWFAPDIISGLWNMATSD